MIVLPSLAKVPVSIMEAELAKQVVLVDDLDGSTADQTVTLVLNGEGVELDLSKANADKLRKALSTYFEHGRKIAGRGPGRPAGGGTRRSGGQRAKRDPEQLNAIREWARANGWPDLGDRGRIPMAAEDAYNAAQGGGAE